MIWGNFSIFRTNCAIASGTRAHMLRGFLRMTRGGNDVRNHRNVWYFWPTTAHNTIRSCMLKFFLQCIRRRLLQFEWSKTLLNLVLSCFIYHWLSYVPLLLLQELHITSLQVSHMLKSNSFSLTQQKHYLNVAAFQDFKLSLLLPHAFEDFASVYHHRKVKKIIISLIASLSFAWIVSNALCFIKAQ